MLVESLSVAPTELRAAGARLAQDLPQRWPLDGVPPMPGGTAPTIAPDLDASLRWWSSVFTAEVAAAREIVARLEATAEAYEGVDSSVADMLRRRAQELPDQPPIGVTRVPSTGVVPR